MQVKNYTAKNSLQLTDVLEALRTNFNRSVWSASSQLKDSHVVLLNQTFGVGSNQLPPAKEVPQLPQAPDSSSDLTVVENTELASLISDSIPALTTTNIQELRAEIQTSVIEELAEQNAVTDYQAYQQSYDDATRSLIVNDIYQKINQRETRRKAFEEKQRAIAETQPQPEQSEDVLTGLLSVVKAGKYKSKFLVDKLGGL